MARRRQAASSAVEILHRRYFHGKPEMLAMLAEERANAVIARKIYRLRTQARLTQQQLAAVATALEQMANWLGQSAQVTAQSAKTELVAAQTPSTKTFEMQRVGDGKYRAVMVETPTKLQ